MQPNDTNPGPSPEIDQIPFQAEHDGVTVQGLCFQPGQSGPAPALIILHGIPRAKPAPGDESYLIMARRFAEHGFITVIFNFQGTGLSTGNLGMAGWVRDLEAALAWVRSRHEGQPQRTALLGFSAGGAVAIHAAAHDPGVDAVAAAAAPARFEFLQRVQGPDQWVKMFRQLGMIRSPDFPGSLPEWEAEFDRIAPIKWVHRIPPRPLLIAHGDRDEIIPAAHARELYQRTGQKADLAIVPRAAHRLRADERAMAAIEEWLMEWKSRE